MFVASKDLCEELYELSGWFHPTKGTSDCAEYTWFKLKHSRYGQAWPRNEAMSYMLNVGHKKLTYYLPAYTVGFLLRKLPSGAGVVANSGYPQPSYTARRPNSYGIPENKDPLNGRIGWDASTPEDALCIMAIELFKAGLLTKEDQK